MINDKIQKHIPESPTLLQKAQKAFFKRFQPVFSRLYLHYTSKKSKFKYKGIQVIVLPGVFHPQFTFSTKFFVDFVESLELAEKQVLELGCGSGLISLHTSAKGAQVTASDINSKALESVNESAKINGLKVKTVLSNLFERLNPEQFDFVFINPPYYPKSPGNISESAWFCGENFEYFHNLFHQLEKVKGRIFMILSEDCQVDRIKNIAAERSYKFEAAGQRRILGELNWIFSIEKSD